MKEGGLSEGSKVGSTLLELRRTVEDLDPAEATGTRKLLGLIPFGDKVDDYFRKYQSAQSHLDCDPARAARRPGRAAARTTPRSTWRSSSCGRRWGGSTSTSTSPSAWTPRWPRTIAELELTDPERAKALRDDVLFYVRQKHQDLLTQLAVSIQDYLAIDIVIKNNIELIKGVDRASTTTISALRTAVIVAQALGNQKLVLDQITALNTTTSAMIERTSEMLRDNSVVDPASRRRRPRSGCRSCRPRSPTSTRPWTRSTRSRSRRWTAWPPRSARSRPRSASPATTSSGSRSRTSALASGSLDLGLPPGTRR